VDHQHIQDQEERWKIVLSRERELLDFVSVNNHSIILIVRRNKWLAKRKPLIASASEESRERRRRQTIRQRQTLRKEPIICSP
jgi:hypothetical protein